MGCSVLLGLGAGLGLSSLLGFPYTLVHAILPFLCLGIGIDDMFVIVRCLSQAEGGAGAERVGTAMRQAGVSITTTTITDVLGETLDIHIIMR